MSAHGKDPLIGCVRAFYLSQERFCCESLAWLGLAGKNIQNTVRRLLSAQEPFKPCLNPTTPVPRPRASLFSDL